LFLPQGDSLIPLFATTRHGHHFKGLASDTPLTHGELVLGVKPTESSPPSPAELVFCRNSSLRDLVGSLRVWELAQKKHEAGGGSRRLNRSF